MQAGWAVPVLRLAQWQSFWESDANKFFKYAIVGSFRTRQQLLVTCCQWHWPAVRQTLRGYPPGSGISLELHKPSFLYTRRFLALSVELESIALLELP
jgi:hypothetical protein